MVPPSLRRGGRTPLRELLRRKGSSYRNQTWQWQTQVFHWSITYRLIKRSVFFFPGFIARVDQFTQSNRILSIHPTIHPFIHPTIHAFGSELTDGHHVNISCAQVLQWRALQKLACKRSKGALRGLYPQKAEKHLNVCGNASSRFQTQFSHDFPMVFPST